MTKGILNNSKVIAITFSITIVVFTLIPKLFGYSFIYTTDVDYDFNAMSAWGTIIGAFIPLMLVVASHIVTKRIDESNERTQREVQESNAITADYVKQLIDEAISANHKIVDLTEEQQHDRLKEKAYKFVSLKGTSKTDRVAEHLGISVEEAFLILEELLKVDGRISAGGQIRIERMHQIIWLKKRG